MLVFYVIVFLCSFLINSPAAGNWNIGIMSKLILKTMCESCGASTSLSKPTSWMYFWPLDIFLIDTYLNIYSVSDTLQFAACLICSYRTYSFSSWNALDRFYDIILFILHIA